MERAGLAIESSFGRVSPPQLSDSLSKSGDPVNNPFAFALPKKTLNPAAGTADL